MFIGEYQHTIDEKGRMAVPAKFRKQLKKGAVVTRGLDNCLFLYPSEEWQELSERLARLPLNQSNARGFVRMMLAGAMDVRIDRQGRILIPDYLRRYGQIKNKVIVTGLYNRLEIWAEEKWQIYKDRAERTVEDMAEHLNDLET